MKRTHLAGEGHGPGVTPRKQHQSLVNEAVDYRDEQSDTARWEGLANAIILQAVEDYKTTAAQIRAYPYAGAYADMRELERFFRSQWFGTLTAVDGEWLLEQLEAMTNRGGGNDS